MLMQTAFWLEQDTSWAGFSKNHNSKEQM